MTTRAERRRIRTGLLFLMVAGFLAATVATGVEGTAYPPATGVEVLGGPPGAVMYTPRPTIRIDGDAGFTAANGVTGGSGTPSDPYIIEGWAIDASSATGISIANTLASVVIRNVSVSGGDATYDGVLLDTVENVDVSEGVFTGNAYGVVAYGSTAVTVVGNHIANSFWEGILVDSSSFVTVRGNDVRYAAVYGIDVYMSTDVGVRENVAANNGFAGINLLNAGRVVVAQNNASTNAVLGIALDFASNVTLLENELWDNDYGMDFIDSQDVVVWGNTLGMSWTGAASLSSSSNVVFEENVFVSNGGGLFASFASDLTVAHNTFLGNAVQGGDDDGSRTAWDAGYPAGGNFWSDYAGTDTFAGPNQDQPTGPDGIGDTPYAVDMDTVDRYPLMAPRYRVNDVDVGPQLDSSGPVFLGRLPPIQGTVASGIATRPAGSGRDGPLAPPVTIGSWPTAREDGPGLPPGGPSAPGSERAWTLRSENPRL